MVKSLMMLSFIKAMGKTMNDYCMEFPSNRDKAVFVLRQWEKHRELIKSRFDIIKQRFNNSDDITMLYVVLKRKKTFEIGSDSGAVELLNDIKFAGFCKEYFSKKVKKVTCKN